MASVYSEPGEHAAEIVAQLAGTIDYGFSIVLLVRDSGGNLWAAHDSGCSCPTPFEDHSFPTDFVPIRVLEDIRPVLVQARDVSGGDVLTFVEAVRKAVA